MEIIADPITNRNKKQSKIGILVRIPCGKARIYKELPI